MNPDHQSKPPVEPNPGLLIIGGFITLAAVFLSFAAIDDITTDNSTSFAVEYAALVACGVWCLFVAVRLLLTRKHVVGIISLVLLAGAIWAQRAIVPGTTVSVRPEHIATAMSLVWYSAVSVAMVVAGFRRLV